MSRRSAHGAAPERVSAIGDFRPISLVGTPPIYDAILPARRRKRFAFFDFCSGDALNFRT